MALVQPDDLKKFRNKEVVDGWLDNNDDKSSILRYCHAADKEVLSYIGGTYDLLGDIEAPTTMSETYDPDRPSTGDRRIYRWRAVEWKMQEDPVMRPTAPPTRSQAYAAGTNPDTVAIAGWEHVRPLINRNGKRYIVFETDAIWKDASRTIAVWATPKSEVGAAQGMIGADRNVWLLDVTAKLVSLRVMLDYFASDQAVYDREERELERHIAYLKAVGAGEIEAPDLNRIDADKDGAPDSDAPIKAKGAFEDLKGEAAYGL